MSADWVPTAKLRWVNRAVGDTDRGPGRGLIPLEYERGAPGLVQPGRARLHAPRR
jgi:hypothetical protein